MATMCATTAFFGRQTSEKNMDAETAAGLNPVRRSGWNERVYRVGISKGGTATTGAQELRTRTFAEESFLSACLGASTEPELNGALAMAGGINLRLLYQSARKRGSGLSLARWIPWTSL